MKEYGKIWIVWIGKGGLWGNSGEFRGSLKGENAGETGEASVKERRRRMKNLL